MHCDDRYIAIFMGGIGFKRHTFILFYLLSYLLDYQAGPALIHVSGFWEMKSYLGKGLG